MRLNILLSILFAAVLFAIHFFLIQVADTVIIKKNVVVCNQVMCKSISTVDIKSINKLGVILNHDVEINESTKAVGKTKLKKKESKSNYMGIV